MKAAACQGQTEGKMKPEGRPEKMNGKEKRGGKARRTPSPGASATIAQGRAYDQWHDRAKRNPAMASGAKGSR